MNAGRSLAGPLPSFLQLAQQAGVILPEVTEALQGVCLGDLSPVLGDPKHSETSRKALNRIEAVVAALRDAQQHIPTLADDVFPFSYHDYLSAIKEANSGKKLYYNPNGVTLYVTGKTSEIFLRLYDKNMHTPDFQGYMNYVSAVHPAFATCLANSPKPVLAESTRQQHTYISASSGSGKTELMKALVHHDVVQGHAAVIIDPTGNLARAVAMWPEFAGKGAARLAYINPKLHPDFIPTLNPLEAEHLDREERGILAGQLTAVLAQVVGKGEWTAQTETVASACFQVLVNRKGATLRDLRLALVEGEKRGAPPHPKAQDIMREGQRHHVAEVQDFFAYEFTSSQFATSKGSLRAKLGHMLRNELFANITGRPSRIVLEELVAARKVIVFDLSAWGDSDAAGAFGRMVIAQLAALGMRRSSQPGAPHVPVHIFVDEVDQFVGAAVLNILSKLRQHGVHMTLAQQTVGYGLDAQDKQQLLNNTAIKFTAGDGQKEMLAMMHAPTDATRGLKQGQFVGRWGRDGEVFKLQVRSDLLGGSRAMTAAEWEEVVQYQLAHYYAPVDGQTEAITPTLGLSTDAYEWPE